MSKEKKSKKSLSEEEKDDSEDTFQKEFESELSKMNAVLIPRKREKKENELSVSYDLTNLQRLDIKTEEEKDDIKNLIKNILLSSHFSFFIYAFSKIFGYLKSLFLYNIFYFFVIKIIYKLMNYKDNDKFSPKAPLWKRLISFNLPELLLIFYYHKRNLTKINTALYSLFTFLNEKISFAYNTDDTKNYLCQVDQNNFNIYLIKKGQNNVAKETLIYLNNPEILEKESFFNSVIAYPNANFEDFDFNNLTPDEEEMYQDIFTFINDVEKKIKEECAMFNSIGTILSNLSFNNLCNYNIKYGLGFKALSFAIMEIYLNKIKKRKRRKILLEEKEKIFNEKNMKKGYFLAVNEYVILLFRIKDEYKNFDESYNTLSKRCKIFLDGYFEIVDRII